MTTNYKSYFAKVEEGPPIIERVNYSPTNRERSRCAKRTKFWCSYCDAQLVAPFGKCPNCGKRENRKKIKIPIEE